MMQRINSLVCWPQQISLSQGLTVLLEVACDRQTHLAICPGSRYLDGHGDHYRMNATPSSRRRFNTLSGYEGTKEASSTLVALNKEEPRQVS